MGHFNEIDIELTALRDKVKALSEENAEITKILKSVIVSARVFTEQICDVMSPKSKDENAKQETV